MVMVTESTVSAAIKWAFVSMFGLLVTVTAWNINQTQDLLANTAAAATKGTETDASHAASIESNARAIEINARTAAALVDLATRLDERDRIRDRDISVLAETQQRVVDLVTRLDERVDTLRESGNK